MIISLARRPGKVKKRHVKILLKRQLLSPAAERFPEMIL
jgi:hypothetical protein